MGDTLTSRATIFGLNAPAALDTKAFAPSSNISNILASSPLQSGGDKPAALATAFTPTSAPVLPPTGGVNPSSGQLVEGAQVGPMARNQATAFNPLEALAGAAQGALEGNAGTAIVSALPLVQQFAQGIGGKDTASGLGKLGGSVRNVFEGDVGSGNVNPTIQSSIASIFATDPIADNRKTVTATSSANGSYGGVMDSIKNFFGTNKSSNSTGPVGN